MQVSSGAMDLDQVLELEFQHSTFRVDRTDRGGAQH